MTPPVPDRPSLAARLFLFCGSLRLTVVLLLFIAVACVYGTFFEGRHGTKAAQATVYKSWWFDIGLALMATNITCSTLRRLPFRAKHTGFVITHSGILTILLGSFLTHRFGIDGQMALLEGESSARLFLDENILTVSDDPDHIGDSFPTRFEYRPWDRTPNETFEVTKLGTIVTVEEYLPNAEFRERILNDGPAENPAVRVTLSSPMMRASVDHWLFARDPRRRSVDMNVMSLSFDEAESEADVAAAFAALAAKKPPAAPPSLGSLVLGSAELKLPDDLSLAVDVSFDRRIPLGESDAWIRLVRYFPDFFLQQGPDGKPQPMNRGNDPRNPTIEFEVGRGDEVVDKRYVFLLYDFQVRKPAIDLTVRWEAPDLARHAHGAADPHGGAGGKALKLFVLRNGEIHYVSTVGDAPRTGVLGLRESVEVSERIGLRAALADFVPRARVTEEVVSQGNEVDRPAIKVRARRGGDEAVAWVMNQAVEAVRVGGINLFVGYGSRSITLPFKIQLVDFKEERYPGNMMSSAYSSRVILDDAERGVVREHLISMNNVLDWQGFRFFQSSYKRNPTTGQETSIFSVNNDPGKPVVYIGFTVLVLGIITLFYIQPAIRRRGTILPAPAAGKTAPRRPARTPTPQVTS